MGNAGHAARFAELVTGWRLDPKVADAILGCGRGCASGLVAGVVVPVGPVLERLEIALEVHRMACLLEGDAVREWLARPLAPGGRTPLQCLCSGRSGLLLLHVLLEARFACAY
jgi:hypothetical protein